ncbi:hypothetical protein Golax_024959, partial [Gossypium laxum]|nr:hypothetical protein [Gossypium laxum]
MTQVMFNTICGKGVIHGHPSILNGCHHHRPHPGYSATDDDGSTRSDAEDRLEDIVREDVNEMDQIQREQWILELMSNNSNKNPQTHVGGDGMMFQF